MSYAAYKVLHIFAVACVLVALAGASLHAANGGRKEDNPSKGLVGMLHGAGLLIALVSGFGLLARLGVSFSGWVWAKVALWIVFGLVVLIPNRMPGSRSRWLFLLLPVLVALAAYIAVHKPF